MYDIWDNDFDRKFDEAVDAMEKKEHRLIWADDLIACKFKNPISYNAFANLVKRQPTVEAEPVKHGGWEKNGEIMMFGDIPVKCSQCGFKTLQDALHRMDYHYCPNCGARMDEDDA